MKSSPQQTLSTFAEINILCPICATPMHQVAEVYSMCKVCRYMISSEQPGAGAEIVSLDAVKEKNFGFICKIIKEKFSQAKTVLDVGSSTGHFLKIANDEDLSATGLEPAEDHLKLKGLAIINLPTSDGLIFRTAFLLNKLGIKAPFNRLWQKGFASPYVHYFNVQNLKRLFENNGFVMQYSSPLYYYTIKGLWNRISCKSPFFVSVFTWIGMVLLYPLLTLRSDCFMACFFLDK